MANLQNTQVHLSSAGNCTHLSQVEAMATENTNLHMEVPEEPFEACLEQSPTCGPPDKPVFISTAEADPASRPDCYTKGVKGYGGPPQHPLFTTTSNSYGRIHAPPDLNPKKFPKNSRFTSSRSLSGMFKDTHFTTSLD